VSAIVTADARGASAAESALERAGISWTELVELVHRQMRSIVGPTRDLEDLVQSALERILGALPQFEARSALSTWTYRICAHVAMNHWRSFKRFVRRFEIGLDRLAAEDLATDGAVDDDLAEAIRRHRLHAALERLGAAQRIVLVLAELEGLPAREIAEIVGVPEPTVRSRLRIARTKIGEILRSDPLFAEDHG
jgi:RNA polymerase sigma-70 factor (ECF subfamily)